METSTHSQLPEYNVSRFHLDDDTGSYDMFKVVCPRKGCGGEFWVRPSWALLQPVLGREDDPPAYPVGRNCPHCSRVSAIPEGLRRQAPVRNVVRRRNVKIAAGACPRP